MITKSDIFMLRDQLARLEPPVLSLYVSVNPAQPENARKGYAIRAKNVLSRLELPEPLLQRVLANLEQDAPQARTRVIYASAGFMQTYDLQVDLPSEEFRTGEAEAHWGEPYLAPLLVALDEYQPYGVVAVDEERWRFFVYRLGELTEVADAFRAIDPSAWRQMTEARQGTPRGVPARGGAGKDAYAERVDEWTRRFFRTVGEAVVEQVNSAGLERIVILGPEEVAKGFVEFIPEPTRSRVVRVLPGRSGQRWGEGEILKALEPVIPVVERERELALLDQIAEKGLRGLSEVLQALQEGRIYQVVVPRFTQAQVWRCSQPAFVYPSQASAQQLCAGEVSELGLLQVLPELCASRGVGLEFVHGEAAERLENEFGGLAGLPRF